MATLQDIPLSVRQLPFPMLVLDKDLIIKDYSLPMLDVLEVDSDTVIQQTAEDLLGEWPSSFADFKLAKGFLNRSNSDYLMHVTRKSELKWLKLSLYPCDKSECYFLHFDEATKNKLALDLAQRAEKVAKIGSWEVDLIKNKLFWSDQTKAIHEVPMDYVPDLEKGINFYKSGYHRERITELVSHSIETGDAWDEELIIVTANGNEKWVRAIGQAEFVNGKCSRLFGVFQDIHHTKLEMERYDALNDRMRIAVQSANIGIWDFNITDNTLIWDENMYELYGVDKAKFSGDYDAWESTVHPEDLERCEEEVRLAIIGDRDFNTEFRIIQSDGAVKHITGMAKVFRDEKGNATRMVGANTDITRLKNSQQRLHKLLEITEKQNKSLLNFAHIVSHNLRSNSSNLLMLSGMLLDGVDAQKERKFTEMIKVAAERLNETVMQLNEVISIRNNKERDFEAIKIHRELEKVVQSVNALVENAKAEIEIAVPKTVQIHGIRPYFNSIILNLLTNSIKYRQPSRPLRIKIGIKENKHQVAVLFEDNGKGIDLKRFGHKLFGMYKTFHGNLDATGFGLFIVKNQMEAMDGTVDVTSQVDQGTTFKLIFNKN